MESIRNALKREIRLKLLASVALLLFGELLCVYAFQLNGAIVIVGIVLMVLGVKFTRDALLNRNVDNSPLMQLLLKEPKKIVWIYSVVTQRMPFGLEFSNDVTIYFKLIDGDDMTLDLSESKAGKALKSLNFKLPHTTFGYTQDREQWFIADPALLYRDEREE